MKVNRSKRAHGKWNMPKLRRRCKKLIRRKYKKTVNLTELDRVWADYVQICIIEPLIKYGKVNVDDRIMFEIVGKHISKKPGLLNILKKGKSLRKGGLVADANMSLTRGGYIYEIRLTDVKKGGKIIFTPHADFSKQVHLALLNTANYYRVEK